MPIEFSLIIPIHNEEPILKKSALALHDYLHSLPNLRFEIIFACNGCTDNSEKICKELSYSYPKIKYLSIEGRGLGTAIHQAALKASYDMMMFYAIDLPFGLSVIGESIEAALKNGGAVVIGSKGHGKSIIQRSLIRSVFSGTISVLNNALFGLGVKDTQGSILFYKEPFRRYDSLMDSPGAFFQTQILIYSRLSGFKIMEIPVHLKKEMRKTRFRLAGDGYRYVKSIFREKMKLVKGNVR